MPPRPDFDKCGRSPCGVYLLCPVLVTLVARKQSGDISATTFLFCSFLGNAIAPLIALLHFLSCYSIRLLSAEDEDLTITEDFLSISYCLLANLIKNSRLICLRCKSSGEFF